LAHLTLDNVDGTSFGRSGTIHPTTRRHVSDDSNGWGT
jgi:hypothetical protein